MLETESEWEVCGEACTGSEAVERADKLQPNFVVMDLVMPRQNGLDATREIVRKHPEIRVLILTLHDYPELQREAKHAGASACLLKGNSADSLLDTVRNLQT